LVVAFRALILPALAAVPTQVNIGAAALRWFAEADLRYG